MRQWWYDVRTIMELCIKLLFARRWFVGVLCGLGVITFVLLSGLTESAEEKGRVEIALVVEEHTESAEQLSAFIKEQPLFLVWEMERMEAMYALERGTVRTVLVIEQGYETWLMQQRKEKKLTLYYPEGQKDVQILSDLMAGGVLEQYCLYQSYAKYSGYKNLEPVSFTEYRQKAKEYQQSEDSGAVFEIQYETPGDTRNEEVGNEPPEHTKGYVRRRGKFLQWQIYC